MKKHLITLGMSAICLVNPYSCNAMVGSSSFQARQNAANIAGLTANLTSVNAAISNNCATKSEVTQVRNDLNTQIVEARNHANAQLVLQIEPLGNQLQQLQAQMQQIINQRSSQQEESQQQHTIALFTTQINQLQEALQQLTGQTTADHQQMQIVVVLEQHMQEARAMLQELQELNTDTTENVLQPLQRRTGLNKRGMAAAHERINWLERRANECEVDVDICKERIDSTQEHVNALKTSIKHFILVTGAAIQDLGQQVNTLQTTNRRYEKMFAYLFDAMHAQQEEMDEQRNMFKQALAAIYARQHNFEGNINNLDHFVELISKSQQ